MRRSHFEAFQPVCPRCLRDAGATAHLELATVVREEGEHVVEGVLLCPAPSCRSEYPIIDGVPILVADLRAFVQGNALSLLGRNDLSAVVESLLGDCMGPGSVFDQRRQYLSTYAYDHYGDVDPDAVEGMPAPGSVLRLADRGRAAAGGTSDGLTLDVGCAVGRTTFHHAEHGTGLVLGVDLSIDMLRVAQRVLREGRVEFPLRRGGLVYDRRSFDVEMPAADRVDFWACDAMLLPLREGSVALAASLNVLDCVAAPLDHLTALRRVLAPGGAAMLASPYDWSGAATPPQAWIGGHSQRSEAGGRSGDILRSLLGDGDHPAAVEGLAVETDVGGVPWTVRLHDRSVMNYDVHLLVARRSAPSGTA